MFAVIAFALVLSLTLYLVPVYLSRQKTIDDAKEFYLAPRPTPQPIFVNSSVAYALQMATFGPFFVWGASGEYWPGIINSVCFGFGVVALLIFRRPIRAFIRETAAAGQSVTLHAFIASAHGNAASVRVFASVLTIIALFGIVVAEMLGVTAAVSPLVGGDRDVSFLVAMILFFLMMLYTALGGNVGVQRSDQFQLGVAYSGLFALLAGMLGSLATGGAPTADLGPAAAILGLAILAIFALKRFRMIDPSARVIADDELLENRAMLKLARAYHLLERVLNVIVLGAMGACLLAIGAALTHTTPAGGTPEPAAELPVPLPAIALVSLALLPIAYQLCDLSNWQRLAALRPDLSDQDEHRDRNLVRSLVRFAVEAPAVWLILLAFGAVAAAYMGTSRGDGSLTAFVSYLTAKGDLLSTVTCAVLLVAILAIALSTMDAVLSALLLAVRSDILFRLPQSQPIEDHDVGEAERVRKTNMIAGLFFFAGLGGLFLGNSFLKFGEGVYVSILLAFYSAQIAFLPLILGGIYQGRAASLFKTDAGGALLTLAAGLAASLICTVLGLAGYGDDLVWWAIPGCLGASSLVFVVSCFWPRKAPEGR